MRMFLPLLLVATSCVAAAKTQSPSSPPSTEPSATTIPAGATEVPTDDLLDAMEKVGVDLKSLKADVEMTEQNVNFGDETTRTGTFVLQRPKPGDTRAHVVFNTLKSGKRLIDDKIEYLLAGDFVTDRVYGRDANDPAGKRETIRQIRKPGDKTDLLKLGEGPFPLPIGQSRLSVKDQFEVTKLQPDDQEYPGLVGLELRPRDTSKLSQRFESIVVWVDPHDAMPRVIITTDQNGGTVKTTRLNNVEINQNVSDADFVLAPLPDDWKSTTVPLEK